MPGRMILNISVLFCPCDAGDEYFTIQLAIAGEIDCVCLGFINIESRVSFRVVPKYRLADCG